MKLILKTLITALFLSNMAVTAFALTTETSSQSNENLVVKLAEFHYSPGYEFKPIALDITIFSDGRVIAKTNNYRTDEKKEIAVADIHTDGITYLTELIGRLTIEELVDPKADEPRCSDTPYLDWKVYQSAIELPIKKVGGCHASNFQTYPNINIANLIIKVLDGMAALVNK